jgi:uncharacterized protein (DUF305 family)
VTGEATVRLVDDEAPPSRTPPVRWTKIAVAAVIVIVVGLAAASAGRPPLPGDQSIEAGFARDMVVHHAQAVEMAEIVRSRTRDPAILTLATDVVLTQQSQIGRFQGWLDVWELPVTGPDEAMNWMGQPTTGRMPGMASAEDVASLGELPLEQMDVRFLQLMIPHHQAAILMADAIDGMTDEREVLALARGISGSQGAEIEYMRQLLAERGAEESEPPVTMSGMEG